nr:hypothetical protein Iba_chr10fCG8680 [Ipomoea batatas]
MGEMLGRSNLIDDIDLNALIVEDYIECNLPNGVESDSLVVCNASSSCFDGDYDDIPDGCNPSAGGGGTSTDANEDDSSIPAPRASSVILSARLAPNNPCLFAFLRCSVSSLFIIQRWRHWQWRMPAAAVPALPPLFPSLTILSSKTATVKRTNTMNSERFTMNRAASFSPASNVPDGSGEAAAGPFSPPSGSSVLGQ